MEKKQKTKNWWLDRFNQSNVQQTHTLNRWFALNPIVVVVVVVVMATTTMKLLCACVCVKKTKKSFTYQWMLLSLFLYHSFTSSKFIKKNDNRRRLVIDNDEWMKKFIWKFKKWLPLFGSVFYGGWWFVSNF